MRGAAWNCRCSVFLAKSSSEAPLILSGDVCSVVGGIDQPLHDLHVVAVHDGIDRQQMRRCELEERPAREGRHLRRRPEIDPDQPARLARGIGPRFETILEARIGDVGRLEHGAVHGKFPAVVDTADSARLDAAERQRGVAVAAIFVEDADLAVAVAEGDEVLAQQLDAPRIAVRSRQLRRQQGRHPEAPKRLAHRRSRPDPADQLVVFPRQHGASPG